MKSKGVFEVEVSKVEVIQGLLPRIYTHTIEEKVNEYQEAMEEGQEFPPITVWEKDGHYWLIDGVHRLIATKRAGKTTIKADIVELENELEARILAIEKNITHGIPLDKEERRELARLLYIDGVEMEELRKLFRVSDRTIYRWVDGVKRRTKDEELKKQALELRRSGLSQEEVAKRLGVTQRTISVWEWEIETQSQIEKPDKWQVFLKNSEPTPEGYQALSRFIEEHEEELRDKTFGEVVQDPALRDVLKFLIDALRKDLKKFIEAGSYDKVKNYLITIEPYRELSLKARKVFFDKAQSLWESLKKEYEERKKFTQIVLEKAKEVLSKPDYRFHSWRTLREDLFRIAGLSVVGKEQLIDDILIEHSEELLNVYRQIPEADENSLTEEELREMILNAACECEETKRLFGIDVIETHIINKLIEKSLRADYSVVNKLKQKAEQLAREMIKEHQKIKQWWYRNYSDELLARIDELDIRISDEDVQEIKQMYEEAKKNKKQIKEEDWDIESWYKVKLEEILLEMGLKLGWVRAFEIADEIYEKVKDFSKKAVRGW